MFQNVCEPVTEVMNWYSELGEQTELELLTSCDISESLNTNSLHEALVVELVTSNICTVQPALRTPWLFKGDKANRRVAKQLSAISELALSLN